MFTLARLWYLDCQTTFLYCHFFNGIPIGLQGHYLEVRIRLVVWTQKVDIAKFVWQIYLAGSFYCSIQSLNLLWSRNCQFITTNKSPSAIAPCLWLAYCALGKFFALDRVGIFVSWASAEKRKRTGISVLAIRKTKLELLLLYIYFILFTKKQKCWFLRFNFVYFF